MLSQLANCSVESRIDRYVYAEKREPFARWLGEWRALKAEGWTVTVLEGGNHAIGFACRPVPVRDALAPLAGGHYTRHRYVNAPAARERSGAGIRR